MNEQPSVIVRTNQNAQDDPVAQMLQQYGENLNTNFVQILHHHIEVLTTFSDVLTKGASVFKTRDEYQNFCIAKLVYDKVKELEFQRSPDLEEYKESYKDDSMPPLAAFHSTADENEISKNVLLRNLKKGDILDLKVLDENESDYRLLVLRKYGSKERLIDHYIIVHLLKSNVELLGLKFKNADLLRAVFFGNVKNEGGNDVKKRMVSLKESVDASTNRSVKLGRISRKDIEPYPEDVSDFPTFMDYLKEHKKFETPQTLSNCMASLGINPYKVYSFHPKSSGLVSEVIKKDKKRVESRKLETSVQKAKKANEYLLKGDIINALTAIDEALEAWPKNDVAHVIRGKTYLKMASGKPCSTFMKACVEFEEALKLNSKNSVAKSCYAGILFESGKRHLKDNDYLNAKNCFIASVKLDDRQSEAAELIEKLKEMLITTPESPSLPVPPSLPVQVRVKTEPVDPQYMEFAQSMQETPVKKSSMNLHQNVQIKQEKLD